MVTTYGCKGDEKTDESVLFFVLFFNFQAWLPLPSPRSLGLQGQPRLLQLLQRRTCTARYPDTEDQTSVGTPHFSGFYTSHFDERESRPTLLL